MGEAKRRGSFEQRQKEGGDRQVLEAAAAQFKKQEGKDKESRRLVELKKTSPVDYNREKKSRGSLLALGALVSIGIASITKSTSYELK